MPVSFLNRLEFLMNKHKTSEQNRFWDGYIHVGSILGRCLGFISMGLRGKEKWARERVEFKQ